MLDINPIFSNDRNQSCPFLGKVRVLYEYFAVVVCFLGVSCSVASSPTVGIDFDMTFSKQPLKARLFLLSLVCLVLVSSLCACSRLAVSGGAGKTERLPFELRIELDKSSYRPGEMVVCTVKLISLMDDDVMIMPLQALESRNESNLNFYIGGWAEATDAVRRVPVQLVLPPNKRQPREVAARGQIEETLTFVNLTEFPGTFKLQAHYTSALMVSKQETRMIISVPIKYTVAGSKLFERDADGMITEDEAIRLAVKSYGKLSRETRAILVPHEDSGLFKWWVTIEKMPHDITANDSPRIAFYVSPYTGKVQGGAAAFIWKSKDDDQILKPANPAYKAPSRGAVVPGARPVPKPRGIPTGQGVPKK